MLTVRSRWAASSQFSSCLQGGRLARPLLYLKLRSTTGNNKSYHNYLESSRSFIDRQIVILKSLALSKLTHLFSVLPNPTDSFNVKLKKVIGNFLWKNKPTKIKYSVLINSIEQWGLKLLDPSCFCMALKINRILEKEPRAWKLLIENQIKPLGGNLIWQCICNYLYIVSKGISNKFLKDLLLAWFCFRSEYSPWTNSSINTNDVIWNNSNIKIANEPFFYKQWHEQWTNKISHLMDESETFLQSNLTEY